jgi:hypothetical protein
VERVHGAAPPGASATSPSAARTIGWKPGVMSIAPTTRRSTLVAIPRVARTPEMPITSSAFAVTLLFFAITASIASHVASLMSWTIIPAWAEETTLTGSEVLNAPAGVLPTPNLWERRCAVGEPSAGVRLVGSRGGATLLGSSSVRSSLTGEPRTLS